MTDNGALLYTESPDNGEVQVTTVPAKYWMLYNKSYHPFMSQLKGRAYYGYGMKFDTEADWREAQQEARAKHWSSYCIYNTQEMFLTKSGVTYYNGMKPEDVSILSFDIETTSLKKEDGLVLLISNTLRKNGKVTRRLFSYDEYESQEEFIGAWAEWVKMVDPSILCGHNVFNFDIPFLVYCGGGTLNLGRGDRPVHIANYTSQVRKDGSQAYDYHNCIVPGREVIDTFHLALKYDIGRNYPSYGLKAIIKHEGLEAKDRQHYDASTIRFNYQDQTEWAKIKAYAEHDADDALALFDLMIPSFFYYCQSIPKTMQQIVNGASGAQVDAFMKRSYIQHGYGLPKASEVEGYQGAISYGNPGLHKSVRKVDVASLYPSIIRHYKIHDHHKDPQRNFLRMVDIFTEERLKNKALAKETGERHYKDMEQAQKIMINSAYGFMGARGLLFNSPKNAAAVTRYGREILQTGIDWAEAKGFGIVNVDTDSFSYTGSKADFAEEIADLNANFPNMIKWENDGEFKKVLVIKTKNYVLWDGKKTKIKGSSLKATMKEPRLKDFITETIDLLLADRKDRLYDLYMRYVSEVSNVSKETIGGWCFKKTVTKSVLTPERTNEQRILDALKGSVYAEGDKVFLFFESDTKLTLRDRFNGTYSTKKLFGKLYNTLEIFETVLDTGVFPNYSLKRNLDRLEQPELKVVS